MEIIAHMHDDMRGLRLQLDDRPHERIDYIRLRIVMHRAAVEEAFPATWPHALPFTAHVQLHLRQERRHQWL